jgi:hypothetical protein
MGKGYAEGPAADERYEALERGEGSVGATARRDRHAVYGSTDDEPEKHFLGWVGDVDPDELFQSGRAWGITVVRRPG